MKKLYSVICLLALAWAGFSQATVNQHLTMSLQNCSQVNATTYQFDVYVTNDGTSDLRANSFQFGVNFNNNILKPGAKTSINYVPSTTDFPELNGYNFPNSSFADHVRVVQSAYMKGNTGKTMETGHPYRLGTFQLTSSTGFVADVAPDFSFQTVTAGGKTLCAAIVWMGTAATTASVTIPNGGTDAMKRVNPSNNSSVPTLSATIDCRIIKNPAGIEQAMAVYPNPASNFTSLIYNSPVAGDYHLAVVDMTGRNVLVQNGTAVQGNNKIDVDVSRLSKGVYVINFKSNSTHSFSRVVVQ